MEDLSSLEKQIRERLSAAMADTRQGQDATNHEMAERALRSEGFWAVASRLLDDIICPRMKMLAVLFPHARLTLADGANTSVCVCNFDHTPEFPASTKLEIGMLPDLANKAAIITYSLEILPIFFDFTRGDQIVVPLNEVNEQLVSSWLDSKLLQFTDTYFAGAVYRTVSTREHGYRPCLRDAHQPRPPQPQLTMPESRTIFALTTVGKSS